MIARARTEDGFGLIELLVSMVMLNVGILAIVAAFNSGFIALRSAGEISTASVLADKQMELYRALLWNEIALDSAEVAAANTDTTYQCDRANKKITTGACGGTNQADPVLLPAACTPVTARCDASQSLPGPDGHKYRIDTYIVWDPAGTGRPVKLITIVVRNNTTLKTLTRLSSTFDESSAS